MAECQHEPIRDGLDRPVAVRLEILALDAAGRPLFVTGKICRVCSSVYLDREDRSDLSGRVGGG